MAKDFNVILGEAQQIKNEIIEGANTANRLGTCLEDIVQRAEVDEAAAAKTTTEITAGDGLTGGGTIAQSRTISVGATDDSVVVGADGIKVDTQDNLTSTSATKPLSAKQGKALQDNKADKSRKVNAGAGLTGGGDLAADRTIDVVSANDGITVNADNIQLNTIDNVTSTSTTKPLSANQGKVLNEKVVQVETDLSQKNDIVSSKISDLVDDVIYPAITKVDGIIIQTTVGINANYECWYIPVEAGKTYNLDITLNNWGTARFGYTSVVPANGVTVTQSANKNAGYWSGQYAPKPSFNAPITGYLCWSVEKTALIMSVSFYLNRISPITSFTNNIDDLLYAVKDVDKTTIEYSRMLSKKFAAGLAVGSTISFVDDTSLTMDIGVVDVYGLNGAIFVSGVKLSTASSVILTDNDGHIIGLINTAYNYINDGIYLDLNDYQDASLLYFSVLKTSNSIVYFNDLSLVNIAKQNINLTSSTGTVLLHFDGVDAVGEYTWTTRKNLVKEYGFRCSFCISKGSFNADMTAWATASIETEYWSLVKEGYDFAFYPNLRCDYYDLNGWNAYMDDLLIKLANLGIHNITTWACGNLGINDALLQACKSHNFKIIRGGGTGSENTYAYKYSESYHSQLPTSSKFIVDSTYMLGGDVVASSNVKVVKDRIDNIVRSKTASSIFSHSVLDTIVTNTDVSTAVMREILQYMKNYADAGKLNVKTFREFYASINKQDGYEFDYGRILKMVTL